MNEQEIEQRLQELQRTAPRLSPEQIDEKIVKKAFHVLGGKLTICVLTLKNGFEIVGESACAHPDNFVQELGEQAAFEKARRQIWKLEGYLLCQKLYEQALEDGKTFLDRLYEELAQQVERRDKLHAFMLKGKPDDVTEVEWFQMADQLDVLADYVDILETRIAIHTKSDEEEE
ncbi:phage family protein [Acinetobacter baumannii 44467_8]|uniref:Gp49 family protein n=1 Tax=Acinetobacter baumannii TaxID=470 RepID=UPI000446C49B|nr:Gp49 family protein [Acinetobacter baumannii]EXW57934.1 phage family protein [Acinetobacter baumannii 44467_8]